MIGLNEANGDHDIKQLSMQRKQETLRKAAQAAADSIGLKGSMICVVFDETGISAVTAAREAPMPSNGQLALAALHLQQFALQR